MTYVHHCVHTSPSARTVETFFRPSVRVLFAWEAFLHGDWPVEMTVVTERDQVTDWFTPWYLKCGREERYDVAGAQPVRLADVPGAISHLHAKRQEAIATMGKLLAADGTVIQLTIPVFAIGSGRSLIIDGNHRLAAAMMLPNALRLLVFRICGPIDPSVLPDLSHWVTSRIE